jgi:hypothetical protein
VIDWLERKITGWAPKDRRRAAVALLFWSTIGMIVNVALYLFDVIGQAELILVTLVLSWLAIHLTAVDVIATTDVREETS